MPHPQLRQIKASAGSGKTYELTQCFLHYLRGAQPAPHTSSCSLGGTGWGDILGITFTNSAAAEMKHRVLDRLKAIALGLQTDPGLSADRAATWTTILLRQYSALNIRTIDSLLHQIVRTAALELGLPPDFETAFAARETLDPILDACLERARQGDARMRALLAEACLGLLLHRDIKGFLAGDRLARELRKLLEYALLMRHGVQPPSATPEALETAYKQCRQAMAAMAANLLEAMEKQGLRLNANARKFLERCAGTGPIPDSSYLDKESLDDCLLKADRGKAPPQSMADYLELPRLKGTLDLLHRGRQIAPLVALAGEVADGVDQFQQAEGKVPAALIPVLAREVLRLEHGVPDALCRLGSRLTHLFVDEFQDTSRPQWEALAPLVEEALSRGGSLTWVGDTKQAIYSWRQGDAALFDAIRDDPALRAMVPRPVTPETLPTNWRSREAIVGFNNAFFMQLGAPERARAVLAALLPDAAPPAVLDSAAAMLARTFHQCGQRIPDRPSSQGGLVDIAALEAADAAELAEAVRQHLTDLLDDLGRRRPWSDITILVRSNELASLAASWLTERDIPVVTENSLLLADHPLIIHSVAFLTFLDCPQDDLAFWTLCNGPLPPPCGLNADDLHAWVAERPAGPLLQAFQERFPQVWAWIAPFYHKSGLMSPYDSVREMYRHWSVEQRFPEAGTFLRRFLEVLHSAEERGMASSGAFLEHWKQSRGEEKLPMPESMNAVRVMTIHKSKGLQFPVVIMPWTNFSIRPAPGPLSIRAGTLEFLVHPCREAGEPYYQSLADAAREALHLLYVAWTRPVDELYILHTAARTLRGENLANVLGTLLENAAFSPPCRVGTPPPSQGDAAQEDALPEPPPAEAHGDDWMPMDWLPRLKIFRNPLADYASTGRRRGLLAHACLEQLRLTGQPLEDARRAVFQGLKTFPLPVPDADAVREELLRALAWYAALPQAGDWLRRGVTEQRILDAQGREHRMDLFIPSDGRSGPVVVEYKTGGPDTSHLVQVRRYLRLLAASGETTPHAVLIYLDGQRCLTVTLSGVSALSPTPLPPETVPVAQDDPS